MTALIPSTLAGLYAQQGEQKLPMPLKHTAVQGKIAGNVARVEVTQSFENPFTQALEAIYIFPLPDESAVDDMEIKIGDRIIKGNIKKREEAQQIYQKARAEGRTAGLLEQERDNIFTQSLANILPGEQIDVTIRYTESLKFAGGNYEFVFPMVVGERYIPGTPIDNSGDTDRVPDATRIVPPILPPGTRSGQDINLNVEIDAGLNIEKIVSPSHQLQIHRHDNLVQVKIGGEDTIPNKDFILRYQVVGSNTQATILTQSDERGGHFALYLIPALTYRPTEIVPKDVVFLIDTSGSQAGEPIAQCLELMRRFINGLNPQDTFTIIDFDNVTTQLSEFPLPNTPENRALALKYINQLDADGGTELLNGIRVAMNFPAATAGRLRSIVLLTDGYIGNDNEILAEVQRSLQPGNRLYSFGVGSSVNRFLLNRLAEIGRGTAQIVRYDEPAAEIADKFFRQINNPVLTEIAVTWQGEGTPPEIYPKILPDLFAEQPLVLFGRKSDRTAGILQVTGIAAGGSLYQQQFHLNFNQAGNLAIAQLWGRARIKDLMLQMANYETTSGVVAITETALNYQLLSQYTAFVAVSDDVRTNSEADTISMSVPVETPDGVSFHSLAATPGRASVQSAKRLTGGFRSFSAPLMQDEEEYLEDSFDESAEYSANLVAPAPAMEMKDILLLDVTPLALGVELLGGIIYEMIPQNSTIPVKKSQIFTTAINNQTSVEINITIGNSCIVADNQSMGKLLLSGLPPAPQGTLQIEVTFNIDVNGVLEVIAKELSTGIEQRQQVSQSIDNAKIEQLRQTAEKNAAAAQQRWQEVAGKQPAELLGNSNPSNVLAIFIPLPSISIDSQSAPSTESSIEVDFSPLWEIASHIEGLEPSTAAALSQHLQQLTFDTQWSGEIIVNFTITNGRVGKILVDDQATNCNDLEAIARLKRSLLLWHPAPSLSTTVRLTASLVEIEFELVN